jgi:hypothetical protein
MKPALLSYNILAPAPTDMDLLDKCEECGSPKIKFITHEQAIEKLKN